MIMLLLYCLLFCMCMCNQDISLVPSLSEAEADSLNLLDLCRWAAVDQDSDEETPSRVSKATSPAHGIFTTRDSGDIADDGGRIGSGMGCGPRVVGKRWEDEAKQALPHRPRKGRRAEIRLFRGADLLHVGR